MPSRPFPCRLLLFLRFLSDRQSLSARGTQHLNGGVVGNLDGSLRIGVKSGGKKEEGSVALNKSLLV